jgi:hypothetical protein
MNTHQCDANHCAVEIDASKGMCQRHWQMVPRDVQQRIYAVARALKSRRERLSSVEFLEAWADAVEAVAAQEGRLTRNSFRNLAEMLKARAAGTSKASDQKRAGCEGKVKYETFKEALGSARTLTRHGKSRAPRLNAYHCTFCNGFHVGNQVTKTVDMRKAA